MPSSAGPITAGRPRGRRDARGFRIGRKSGAIQVSSAAATPHRAAGPLARPRDRRSAARSGNRGRSQRLRRQGRERMPGRIGAPAGVATRREARDGEWLRPHAIKQRLGGRLVLGRRHPPPSGPPSTAGRHARGWRDAGGPAGDRHPWQSRHERAEPAHRRGGERHRRLDLDHVGQAREVGHPAPAASPWNPPPPSPPASPPHRAPPGS